MKKYLFLTSAAIMCMACPAFAENFPGDGNMLENKTYDNAATYTNTGIYEGTVVANADYSLNPYSVAAGSYFTGIDNSTNQATTATCTSGNYCPGVASTTYDNNAFGDTGLQTCPNGYASSDLGASANTQCYRTCDIANMGANGTIANIAHAASLSGNDYYGAGTDTCVPATCVNGWHVKAGAPDLIELPGTASYLAVISNDGNFLEIDMETQEESSNGQAHYSITADNSWAVDYGNGGIVQGYGICSTRAGNTEAWTSSSYESLPENFVSNISNETGQEGAQYCYCNLTGYKPVDGELQSLSSPWVFIMDEGSYSDCTNRCAVDCSNPMQNIDHAYRSFSAVLFGSIQSGPATCEANTINITWNDASAEDIAATGAATTVYEGDIKTPLKAVMKPGKTFVGWKFVKSQQ